MSNAWTYIRRHIATWWGGMRGCSSRSVGRLGDRERAQEAAQETFVRAYFQLGKLKKQDAFLSWLLAIGSARGP